MATLVNVQQAKTDLSALLRRSEAGDDIVIARAGKPIARLAAIDPRKRDFSRPLFPNLPHLDAECLFDPMDDEDLKLWEAKTDDG